jgi:hypothetical protein
MSKVRAPFSYERQSRGSVGSYVKPLMDTAIQIGEKIGPVTADMGNTSCQLPFAPDYIRKLQKRGTSVRSAKRRNAERGPAAACSEGLAAASPIF